ncbi:MAG: hypothetical protein LBP92_07630 [Deltaproteobacteria bacterium]|jgi:hypothetical protein|nr:hypothetical protein [Deltaproteobacteria bacterium]
MSHELTAFLNFEFEKKQTTTKVFDNDVVSVAKRWQLNWREYESYLAGLGIDSGIESRPSLIRYGNPQPDVKVLDDLISFQSSLRGTMAGIVKSRKIPPSVYNRFFNEADGVLAYLQVPATLTSDITPENIASLNLSYSYDTHTYRVFMSAVIRGMIVDKTIFDLGMDDEGRFHMSGRREGSGGIRDISEPGPKAATRDGTAPGHGPRRPQPGPAVQEEASLPLGGSPGPGQSAQGAARPAPFDPSALPEEFLASLAAAISQRLAVAEDGRANGGNGKEVPPDGSGARTAHAAPVGSVSLGEHEAYFTGGSRFVDDDGLDFICFPEFGWEASRIGPEPDDGLPAHGDQPKSADQEVGPPSEPNRKSESVVQEILDEIAGISEDNISDFGQRMMRIKTDLENRVATPAPPGRAAARPQGETDGGAPGQALAADGAGTVFPYAGALPHDQADTGIGAEAVSWALKDGAAAKDQDNLDIGEVIIDLDLTGFDDEEPLLLEDVVTDPEDMGGNEDSPFAIEARTSAPEPARGDDGRIFGQAAVAAGSEGPAGVEGDPPVALAHGTPEESAIEEAGDLLGPAGGQVAGPLAVEEASQVAGPEAGQAAGHGLSEESPGGPEAGGGGEDTPAAPLGEAAVAMGEAEGDGDAVLTLFNVVFDGDQEERESFVPRSLKAWTESTFKDKPGPGGLGSLDPISGPEGDMAAPLAQEEASALPEAPVESGFALAGESLADGPLEDRADAEAIDGCGSPVAESLAGMAEPAPDGAEFHLAHWEGAAQEGDMPGEPSPGEADLDVLGALFPTAGRPAAEGAASLAPEDAPAMPEAMQAALAGEESDLALGSLMAAARGGGVETWAMDSAGSPSFEASAQAGEPAPEDAEFHLAHGEGAAQEWDMPGEPSPGEADLDVLGALFPTAGRPAGEGPASLAPEDAPAMPEAMQAALAGEESDLALGALMAAARGGGVETWAIDSVGSPSSEAPAQAGDPAQEDADVPSARVEAGPGPRAAVQDGPALGEAARLAGAWGPKLDAPGALFPTAGSPAGEGPSLATEDVPEAMAGEEFDLAAGSLMAAPLGDEVGARALDGAGHAQPGGLAQEAAVVSQFYGEGALGSEAPVKGWTAQEVAGRGESGLTGPEALPQGASPPAVGESAPLAEDALSGQGTYVGLGHGRASAGAEPPARGLWANGPDGPAEDDGGPILADGLDSAGDPEPDAPVAAVSSPGEEAAWPDGPLGWTSPAGSPGRAGHGALGESLGAAWPDGDGSRSPGPGGRLAGGFPGPGTREPVSYGETGTPPHTVDGGAPLGLAGAIPPTAPDEEDGGPIGLGWPIHLGPGPDWEGVQPGLGASGVRPGAYGGAGALDRSFLGLHSGQNGGDGAREGDGVGPHGPDGGPGAPGGGDHAGVSPEWPILAGRDPADEAVGGLDGQALVDDSLDMSLVGDLELSALAGLDLEEAAEGQARWPGDGLAEDGGDEPIVLLDVVVGDEYGEEPDPRGQVAGDGLEPDKAGAPEEAVNALCLPGAEGDPEAQGGDLLAGPYEGENEAMELVDGDEAIVFPIPEPWPGSFRGSDGQAVEFQLATMESRLFKRLQSRSLLMPANWGVNWKGIRQNKLKGL